MHNFFLIHTHSRINIPTMGELYAAFALTTTVLYAENFSAYEKINYSKLSKIFSSTFHPVLDSFVLRSITTMSKGIQISTPIFSNYLPHNLNQLIAKCICSNCSFLQTILQRCSSGRRLTRDNLKVPAVILFISICT